MWMRSTYDDGSLLGRLVRIGIRQVREKLCPFDVQSIDGGLSSDKLAASRSRPGLFLSSTGIS
ncbi:hypothetical protein PG997_000585 [Apiospora hydei]|uniref:Uncharacterized protein n=1 Tax=Apiospora hydei TaxID=1337664 RepID=A0ABR1XB76_9PEZI